MSGVEIIGTPERTVTRRKFIMGVIAAGVLRPLRWAISSKVRSPCSGPLLVQGSVERLITLNVNGQQRRVDVMKQETLAFTLRYKLGAYRHQAWLRPCGRAEHAPYSSTG